MRSEKYITSSCSIDNGTVKKDSMVLSVDETATLPSLLLSIYQNLNLHYPKFYKMDNLSKLGWLAAEVLLKDGFDKTVYQPETIGVVLANASSSLDNDIKYMETVSDMASPSVFVYTLPNIVIGEMCIRNGFKGEHALFIQEAFDAGFIEQQVSYLLDKNILQASICGWVEVLGQNYKAVLFLIEKEKKENSILFSAENMNTIFNKS